MCYDDTAMVFIKCRLCKQEKLENEYRLFRGRLNKTCITCRERNNGWYAEDINGKRTKAKKRYQRIKDSIAQYRSDHRLDKKYSLIRTEWEKMLASQNNLCLICKCGFNPKRPCVDHDHKTGKVRGLLCRNCNLRLQVVEDEEFVKQATIYLKSMK